MRVLSGRGTDRPGGAQRTWSPDAAMVIERATYMARHLLATCFTGARDTKSLSAGEGRCDALGVGGVEPVNEVHRRGPWLSLFEELTRDVRFAARMLRRSPGYAFVAVMTLALGIGATGALFTIGRDAMLRTLPAADPHLLVELGCVEPLQDALASAGCDTSYAGFEMYRARRDVIAGAFAFAPIAELTASDGSDADIARGMLVSGSMADVLGIEAAAGRLLGAADDRADAPTVVVLGHAYWQRRFGGDRSIVGRTLWLNRQAATVVGVAPPAFRGFILGDVPDVILAVSSADRFLGPGTLANSGSWWLRVIARRRPEYDLARLRQLLEPTFAATVEHTLQSVPPELGIRVADGLRRLRFHVEPAGVGALSEFRNGLDRPLRILAATISCFLLIACANLAGLVGARAAAREGELGLRLALGATRSRLLRQVVTETLVVAVAGGGLGLLVGSWLAPAVVALAAGEAGGRALDLRPDFTVLGVIAAVTIATGLLAAAGGLARAARVDAQVSMKKLRDGGEASRTAHVVLAAQCTLTVILLVGAAVFIRTLANLRAVDPGFVADGRVLADVVPGLAGYGQQAAAAYVDRVVDALQKVPGIRSVTYSSAAIGQLGNTTLVDVDGFDGAAASQRTTGRQAVGPSFAATVGLRLLHGRDITTLDAATPSNVAIVNESFARHYFGEVNAVGRQFTLLGEREPHTIVGVVANARDRGVRLPAEPVVYEAPLDHAEEGVTFTVRGDLNTGAWLPDVDRALRSADRAVPVRRLRPAASDLEDALRRERVVGTLTVAFGALAVFLVSLGLYGTVSGIVARRAPEIGIRMALGSSARRVIWLVTGDACLSVTVGAVAGLLAASALERYVQAQLFGVSASDPAISVSVLAVVSAAAAAAAALPARRAVRVDPSAALRAE